MKILFGSKNHESTKGTSDSSKEGYSSGSAPAEAAPLNPLWDAIATAAHQPSAARPSFGPPPPPIQMKLTVGAPDDQYEQEADRVADMVMRMPEPAAAGRPPIARQAAPSARRQACAASRQPIRRAPQRAPATRGSSRTPSISPLRGSPHRQPARRKAIQRSCAQCERRGRANPVRGPPRIQRACNQCNQGAREDSRGAIPHSPATLSTPIRGPPERIQRSCASCEKRHHDGNRFSVPRITAAAAVRPQRLCSECQQARTQPVGLSVPSTTEGAQRRIQRVCSKCEDEHLRRKVGGGAATVQRSPTPGPNPPIASQPLIQRVCSECEQESAEGAGAGGPSIQRACAACDEELRRRPEQEERALEDPSPRLSFRPEITPEIESYLNGGKGSGQHLPISLRHSLESRFGEDFGGVRIHSDAPATRAARGLGARAFTLGHDIVFGAGEYSPHSQQGRRLLSHELTHVVQQRGGSGPAWQAGGGPKAAPTGVQADFLDDLGDIAAGARDRAGDAWDTGTDLAGDAWDTGKQLAGDAYRTGKEVINDPVGAIEGAVDTVTGIAGEAWELAESLASTLGGSISLSGGRLVVTIPPMTVCPAVPLEFELDEISESFPFLVGGIPINPAVFLYGSLELAVALQPKLQLQLGPCSLNGLRIVVDPLGGTYSAGGSLSVAAAVGLGAEVRGGVRGEVGAIVIVGGVPVQIPAVGLEVGLAGAFMAVGAGNYTAARSLSYSGGVFRVSTSDQLDLGLQGSAMVGAYGQLDALGQNLCRLYWPLWSWHDAIAASINVTESFTLDTSGPSVSVSPAIPSITGIPIGRIPLALDLANLQDDCPLYDFFDAVGLFPTNKKGPPPPWHTTPRTVYPRAPAGYSSKCRAACGPDCDTCDAPVNETFCFESGNEHYFIDYPDYTRCKSHPGCLAHDACYDYAVDQGERGLPGLIFGPRHRVCDLECACTYNAGDCIGWIRGQGAGSDMFFSGPPTVHPRAPGPCSGAPPPTPGPTPGTPPECGSQQLPLTVVTHNAGAHGWGAHVKASPLTKCPGNTRGSKPTIYPPVWDCIRDLRETNTWARAHLLHGATSRTGRRHLHGPGDQSWNLIVSDRSINGSMRSGAEGDALGRVYGRDEVLWYSTAVEYWRPGGGDLDYYAWSISVSMGPYDTNAGPGANPEGSPFPGYPATYEHHPDRIPPHARDPNPCTGSGGGSGGGEEADESEEGDEEGESPIRVCSRPLNFPWWTGLRSFRHAFVFDPVAAANYAIREPLVWGNGVTTSCSPKTSASGPPDEPHSSICKPCETPPGQTPKGVSKCLQRVYNSYPGPNLYRNLPDPDDRYRHGPNSNSFGAWMSQCCHEFDRSGLGILPGWNHGPAGPCPPRPLSEQVESLLGSGDPRSIVHGLAELGDEEKSAVLADDSTLDSLRDAIGSELWPAARRVLRNEPSVTVPSLNESTVFLAKHYIAQGMFVDALYVMVRKLQDRGFINSRLATFSYIQSTSSGEGETNTRYNTDPRTRVRTPAGPSDVEIHDPAFADASWLYSTIMHEYVHALQHQREFTEPEFNDPEASAIGETEAYLWEIEHAHGSGLIANPEHMAELGRRLTDHFNELSDATKTRYRARYDAAMERVRAAEGGVALLSLDDARRTVREASRRMAALVRERPPAPRRPADDTDENREKRARIDREIAEIERDRENALVDVVLTENPVVEIVDRARGIYRVPVVDGRGRVTHLYGAITVVWHLAQVSPAVFSIGARISTRETPGVTTRLGVAGTAVQGRVHPFPGDIDFVEEVEVEAENEPAAGRILAHRIIDFVDRNRRSRTFEFLRLIIFFESGSHRWTEADLFAAKRNPVVFGRFAAMLTRARGGINTFWRAWVDDRFIDITKVMTIRAIRGGSGDELFSSVTHAEYNLAYLEEPPSIPAGNLGAFAAVMREKALELADAPSPDFLKAAKRAYNYLTVIGNLEGMRALEPVFRTEQARVGRQASVMEAVARALLTRRSFPTRILEVREARNQLRMSADVIEERLPPVSGITPTPRKIAADLRDLIPRLRGDGRGILEPDDALSGELNDLLKATKTIISQGIRARVEPVIDAHVR